MNSTILSSRENTGTRRQGERRDTSHERMVARAEIYHGKAIPWDRRGPKWIRWWWWWCCGVVVGVVVIVVVVVVDVVDGVCGRGDVGVGVGVVGVVVVVVVVVGVVICGA